MLNRNSQLLSAIKPDWRAGVKSKQQLSSEYGVSRAAKDKHFDKAQIKRDLTKKIQDQAEALVTASAVTGQVTAQNKVTENPIVEANANVQAVIRLAKIQASVNAKVRATSP